MPAARICNLLVALALVVTGVSRATASVNRERDYRSWTFKELGITADTFRPKPVGFDQPTVIYELPQSAHEGGKSWWIIHLHFVVDVNPKSRPGSAAIIGAGANQVGTASIQLKSARKNGRDVILWTEDGMINGVVTHVARGTRLDIRFSNVLPIAGVRPGRNELSFVVGQNGLVRKLTVMPDSSIEHTSLAPAQITLSERLSRPRVSVGELVRDRVTVRNVGGSTANRVEIAVGPVPSAITVIGRDQRTLGSLASNRVMTASFLLRASQMGRFTIGVSASSSSNQQVAIQHITVSAPPVAHARTARSKRSLRALIVVLTAAVVFFALVALIGGAMRRPRSRP